MSETQVTEGFAGRFREAVAASGLTHERLAEILDVREATISEWANGRRSPRLEHLERLPAVLGVSGHWLLTGQGERSYVGEGEAARTLKDVRAALDGRAITLPEELLSAPEESDPEAELARRQRIVEEVWRQLRQRGFELP